MPSAGFEPATSSLGVTRSNPAELREHRFKKDAGFKKTMIVKVLGVVDIMLGLLFWIAMVFSTISLHPFLQLLALVVIVKGIVFLISFDFASILDVICGCLILYGLSFGLHLILVVIVAIFLIQKGIFSLLG